MALDMTKSKKILQQIKEKQMEIKPTVGDTVEVKSDKGTITNAPWTQKVVKVVGDKTFFDEGGSKPVGYKLERRNYMRSVIQKDMSRHFVYSH